MSFTPVERLHIKNAVERVLHVPGNYNGGRLEMAMVFDCNLPEEVTRRIGSNTAALLKAHSETFRNVRLNTICWLDDGVLVKEIGSIPGLQMNRGIEGYTYCEKSKRLELLMDQLKLFYARSKIIMFFTDGNYRVEDDQLLRSSMYPFLHRKLILIRCLPEAGERSGITVISGTELLLQADKR